MSVAKVNFTAGNAAPVSWNNLTNGGSVTGLLNFSDNENTGWNIAYTANPNDAVANSGTALDGVGDAAWYVAGARDGHVSTSTTVWAALSLTVPAGTYNIRGFSSVGNPSRITSWRVNGGALQSLANHNGSAAQNANDVRFNGITADGTNPILIEYRRADASGGAAYATALYIEDVPASDTTAPTFVSAPTVTVTSDTGHTISSTLNESGALYAVRLASGATAPSSPQVVAGQNNTGAAALEAVSVAATAATSADLTFSTGAASTAYDYYIVAEDDEATPNLQAAPTLVSATTAAAAVPGIGQLTVQFEGVAINVADWHIITRLAADQSILYNQTGQSSDASGNIAAFATTSGSVGDPVRVEGLSAADAYSFVIEQNLGNIA
jgi:hypothetical protein